MATEPIAKLLGASAELHPLSARLAYIRRLQRRYRTIAPGELAEASRVCAIDGTTLVVCAASGPVAAVLRQLAPRILEAMRVAARKSSKHSEDQELNSIRIEVQVKEITPRRPVRPRPEPPREKLEALAERLSDSPLKDALKKMSARKK